MQVTKRTKTIWTTLVAIFLTVGCTAAPVTPVEEEPTTVFTNLKDVTSIAIWPSSKDVTEATIVPQEYVSEILDWIGGFQLGSQQSESTKPDSYSLLLTYTDGSTETGGIDVVVRNGVTYTVEHPDFPACWEELWKEEEVKEVSSTPAQIEVVEASDEQLATYTNVEEFNAGVDEYRIPVYLTTDQPISNLAVYGLTWDETKEGLVYTSETPMFQLDTLTPEKPLVLQVSFPGTMPTVGIAYTDSDGSLKQFQIAMSGEDGSIYLLEETPTE